MKALGALGSLGWGMTNEEIAAQALRTSDSRRDEIKRRTRGAVIKVEEETGRAKLSNLHHKGKTSWLLVDDFSSLDRMVKALHAGLIDESVPMEKLSVICDAESLSSATARLRELQPEGRQEGYCIAFGQGCLAPVRNYRF